MKPRLELLIKKERLKFSAAHLTVFPDGTKERLHGHNYQIELGLKLKDQAFEAMVPFALVKEIAQGLADAWDEFVLLPSSSRSLKMEESPRAGTTAFELCGVYYALPAAEIIWLDAETVSAETLALIFSERFVTELGRAKLTPFFSELSVRIEESPGQGARAVCVLN